MSYGRLESGNLINNYFQGLAAISWQKHLNRIGNERFLVKAGKSWSDQPLPLSKLFAGNGYRLDKYALYAFGGLLTMYPYDFYSDLFVCAHWRHDFDWKLFRSSYSAPSISLGYNMLWGTMEHPEVHLFVPFRVPDEAYHESGVMINDIIRTTYLNLYYVSLHLGYFYHWAPAADISENGRVVLGFGLAL
jgi:hypothetical protein